MLSKLHKAVAELLKEMFPVHQFLYEYPYSKIKVDDIYLHAISSRLHADIYDVTFGIIYEIQGIQHYEQIEFFGGTKGFSDQKRVDRWKRQIVGESESIDLVEIPYNFKLNKENLLRLIKEAKVDIR